MSINTQQLGDIHSEITTHFADDAFIRVLPVHGDPPDQYEVTYNLPGTVKDETNQVHIVTGHVVTIAIPFGFPHFPPSCKPKSAIFHPDFDSAAICLSDFWQQDRHLSELIRYIGQLISGVHYSRENAFNEEAAAWYRDHRDQLPFVTLPSDDTADSSETSPPTIVSETLELDTLDETDFENDFDFSEADLPETTWETQPPSPPADNSAQVDVEQLWLLARQKNFHQLQQELDNLPATLAVDGQTVLTEQCSTALSEAKRLYEEADEFEHKGQAHKALAAFQEVEQIVSDFPNIRAAIRRCEQSVDMLGEISQLSEEDPFSLPDDSAQKGKVAAPKIKPLRPDKSAPPDLTKSSPKESRVTFFNEKNKKPLNIVPVVVSGCIVALIATLAYFYWSINNQYSKSESFLSLCTNQLTAQNFSAAEQACLSALDAAKGVVIIKQSETAAITKQSREILNSEAMKQGLLGNVLHEGKYVSKKELAIYMSYKEALEQGDSLLAEANWEEAIHSFQNALRISQTSRDVSTAPPAEIEQKIALASFRSALQSVLEVVNRQDWDTAVANLTEMQAQLSKLAPGEQKEYGPQLDQLLAKCRFAKLKKQADSLFAQSDWTGAFSLFQKAIELGRDLSEPASQELSSLQENVTKAELYSTINVGNKAFSSGQWNLAIKNYELAKTLLINNTELLNLYEPEKSLQKLERIILQSLIIRDRQMAQAELAAGRPELAIKMFRDMINSVQNSRFSRDAEFTEILTETRKDLSILEEKQFIEGKIKYLVDNYKSLFAENYPAADPSSLTSPVAAFEKNLGQLLLFKLQCTETSRGRPLTLVMFYTYNLEIESWQFYSEP